MVKFTIGDPLAALPKQGRRAGRAKLPTRRQRGEDGKLRTVYSVDLQSETLGDEMLTVFRRNVERARREHRELMKKVGVAAE